jgi:hypothetical protein
MRTYTSQEHHLLEWLMGEDDSAYGECKGGDLDRLIELGLVGIKSKDPRGKDYDRVGLTAEGFDEALRLGKWSPQ